MGRRIGRALDTSRGMAVEAWRRCSAQPAIPSAEPRQERALSPYLKAEVFALERLRDLAAAQRAFDRWRIVYNFDRPHEALDQEVPASRYRPSARSMPDRLPTVEYDEHEIVRAVSTTRHYVRFKGRSWIVPRAFCGERVAIRPRGADGRYGIFFGSREIARIDLSEVSPCETGVRL